MDPSSRVELCAFGFVYSVLQDQRNLQWMDNVKEWTKLGLNDLIQKARNTKQRTMEVNCERSICMPLRSKDYDDTQHK